MCVCFPSSPKKKKKAQRFTLKGSWFSTWFVCPYLFLGCFPQVWLCDWLQVWLIECWRVWCFSGGACCSDWPTSNGSTIRGWIVSASDESFVSHTARSCCWKFFFFCLFFFPRNCCVWCCFPEFLWGCPSVSVALRLLLNKVFNACWW